MTVAKRFPKASAFPALLGLLAVFACSAVARAQTFTVLYTFTGGTDGSAPFGGLVRDKKTANLYGTAHYGGDSTCYCGVVFKLDDAGQLTVLHEFGLSPDGQFPTGDLVRDASGNLYGVTYGGGLTSCFCGIVFKVSPSGKETILYTFTGNADGAYPGGGLVRDSSGNLYGTTGDGGDLTCAKGQYGGCGVVFKLGTTNKETVLYTFLGKSDGGFPGSALARDSAGNIFGTSSYFGCDGGGNVYEIKTSGKESVLHCFTGYIGRSVPDGSGSHSGVIRDSAGNLYGTTQYGGTVNCNCGTVFRLDAKGKETLLYTFNGGSDGANPIAGVVLDAQGNLYGTTETGGAYGNGTVFKLDAAGNETILYSFSGGSDGGKPESDLILDSSGNLYGTTFNGGYQDNGVVFKITP